MKTYKFAEVPVAVKTRGDYFGKVCADYLAEDETPEFEIFATDEDLNYEQSQTEGGIEYPRPYLEYIAIYRKFCEQALDYDVVLCHGSVLEYEGAAYMFTAPSGTGKSTHAKLWRQHFGECVIMINDDKPLLKFEEDGIYAYGTPWDGKHHLSTNKRAKLAGICFLHRGEINTIRQIDAQLSVTQLMNQIYRPRDGQNLMKTLDYAERLIKEVPMYDMDCNMSEEAATVAYNAMKKER